MSTKTELIAAWVTPDIKKRAEDQAAKSGMKIGEYIRKLILDDLEK
jgi:hypothetical protein